MVMSVVAADTCPACQMGGHKWSDETKHPEIWGAERVRVMRFERTKNGDFRVGQVLVSETKTKGMFHKQEVVVSSPVKARVRIDKVVDLSRGGDYIRPEDFVPEDMEMRFEREREVTVVGDVNNAILIVGTAKGA